MTIRRTVRTTMFLLAATAAPAVTAAAGDAGAAAARSLRIAYVDVDRVLLGYNKGNDLYGQIKSKFEPQAEAIKQRAQMIGEERRRLETNPRTDQVEYLKKKQELEMQLAKLQQDEKEYMEGRSTHEVKAMSEVWNDVLAATQAYARDNGIDLVIKQQARDKDDATDSRAAFYRMVANRTVLYAAAGLDITDDIVRKLNTEYERGGGAAPPTGGGTGGDVGREAPPAPAPAKG